MNLLITYSIVDGKAKMTNYSLYYISGKYYIQYDKKFKPILVGSKDEFNKPKYFPGRYAGQIMTNISERGNMTYDILKIGYKVIQDMLTKIPEIEKDESINSKVIPEYSKVEKKLKLITNS